MFKKHKMEVQWEMQTVFDEARERLAQMEAHPEEFDMSEKEGDLLAQLNLAKGRLDSAIKQEKDLESEIKELKRTARTEAIGVKQDELENVRQSVDALRVSITTIMAKLETLRSRNPLEDQRRFVQELAKAKLDWEKEHKPTRRPLSWDVIFAGAVTIGVAISGAIVEQTGHLGKKLIVHTPLPRIWKQ